MTEPLPEPRAPATTQAPVDAEEGAPPRAFAIAWGIAGLFVLLFAGTFLIALLYLAAD